MFSIAVFGDSITFGIGDTENKRGWVGRLREYFEPKAKYNALYNLGIPGNKTSNDILSRIDSVYPYCSCSSGRKAVVCSVNDMIRV